MTVKTKKSTPTADGSDDDPLLLRQPTMSDGAAVYKLIQACPPLDLNSNYVYLLLCTHFASTCIVAHQNHQLVGFISAYQHPEKQNTLFVWQVAVHESMRGRGLAQYMLEHLLKRSTLEHIKFIETTVDPENHASRRLFQKLAQQPQTELVELDFFQSEHFVKPQVEPLLRIGPLRTHLL